jgi:hypothetical protein
MDFNRFLCVALVCALVQGCGPIINGTRTLVIEPIHYCRRADELIECHRNHDLAEQAWAEFAGKGPCVAHSDDFAKGFKQGFADFLFAGGTGAPPPLPPRHYWGSKYQSAEGRRAIEDWFGGFRQGAETAKHNGWRRFIEVPTTATLAGSLPAAATAPPRPEPVGPAAPVLPSPRPLEKAPDEAAAKSRSPHSTVGATARPKPVVAAAPVYSPPPPQAKAPADDKRSHDRKPQGIVPLLPASGTETVHVAPAVEETPIGPVPAPIAGQGEQPTSSTTRVWYFRRHAQTVPAGSQEAAPAGPPPTQ